MIVSIKVNQTYIITLLALLVVSSLSACSSPATLVKPTKEPLGPPDRVDVVYFHLGEACHCMDPTGECIYATVWLNFQDELASGKLTFQRLKLDDKNNANIAEKYDATPFSLFINTVRGDSEHIIAVPEIWPIRYESEALEELVKSKIRQSLEVNE
jgi:hypothetical protein